MEHLDALCLHSDSDHNQWAVCATAVLASGGRFLNRMHPELVYILEKCLEDDLPGARQLHIQAALEFIDKQLH